MADHREALRRIAAHEPLRAWSADATDLPWGDPAFSERMLREHLDQAHELASRRLDTIERQTDRLIEWLRIGPGSSLLDVTCGPGLVAAAFARRAISVTGVDVSPAAIRHAIEITAGMPCTFIEADVREVPLPLAEFDAAIYLYGQSGVPRPDDLREILFRVRRSLRPGAPLVLEMRDAATVDRSPASSWWAGADDLFGREAHVVLTERAWDPDARATVERHLVLDVETGALSIFGVTERAFEQPEIAAILSQAGFPKVEFRPGWDGLLFEGATDWLVAIGQ
ncbi:MAG: methyltransferase domain-containing protein [Candidatus Limnocylindrales bacterium]